MPGGFGVTLSSLNYYFVTFFDSIKLNSPLYARTNIPGEILKGGWHSHYRTVLKVRVDLKKYCQIMAEWAATKVLAGFRVKWKMLIVGFKPMTPWAN